MRFNVRRRMEYIEFCLRWEGHVGRKHLQETFEISPQQASKDLTLYSENCPHNMIYNPRQKAYLPSERFKPQFIENSSKEYFRELELLANGYRSKDEIWITRAPEFETVQVGVRKVDVKVLALVVSAINMGTAIKFDYTSISSGATTERLVVPRALGGDGHRWHIRGFDVSKDRFSDFLLSRIDRAQKYDGTAVVSEVDHDWEETVVLELEADPGLPEDRRIRIEQEYDMNDRVLFVRTRKAMLFYVLRNYGFDPWLRHDATEMENRSSFMLHIKNLGEVEEWLGRR